MNKQTDSSVSVKSILTPDYFRLALPLLIQEVVTALLGAADALMLGRLSQDALSAITLACQVTQIFTHVLMALCTGSTALQVQYHSCGDNESVHRVTVIAIQFSVISGLVFFLLTFFLPEAVMRLFTDVPSLITLGADYLRIISFSYLFMSFSQIYLNVMKNVGHERVSATLGTLSAVLNIILNYFLIFGTFGFPALGVRGAAVATTVTRGVELLLIFFLMGKSTELKGYPISDFFKLYRGLMRKFLRYTVPTMINAESWMLATALTMAILGHMGSDVVAAGSVAGTLFNIASAFISGVTASTAIILGRLLGKGEIEKARRTGDTLLRIEVVFSLFIGLLLILTGPLTFPFFNTLSAVALNYLKYMILIMGFKCVGRSFGSTISCGILYTGGDLMYLMKMDLINMWLVILPLSALAAFVLHLHPVLVFLIINLDEFTKLYHMLKRYRTYCWAKNLTVKDWAQPGKYDRQIREKIIDDMPLGVMVVTNAGRIVLTNDACAGLLGKTRDELEGSNYRNIFLTEEQDDDRLSDLFIEAMHDKTTARETDLLYPNAESGRKLHVRASYMEDEDCRIGLCIMISEASR